MPAVHLQQMSEVTISVDRAWHLWECPASVLDPKIQQGMKLPRWNSLVLWNSAF